MVSYSLLYHPLYLRHRYLTLQRKMHHQTQVQLLKFRLRSSFSYQVPPSISSLISYTYYTFVNENKERGRLEIDEKMKRILHTRRMEKVKEFISGEIPISFPNKGKSKEFRDIDGKTSFILKGNMGISQLKRDSSVYFQTQRNRSKCGYYSHHNNPQFISKCEMNWGYYRQICNSINDGDDDGVQRFCFCFTQN